MLRAVLVTETWFSLGRCQPAVVKFLWPVGGALMQCFKASVPSGSKSSGGGGGREGGRGWCGKLDTSLKIPSKRILNKWSEGGHWNSFLHVGLGSLLLLAAFFIEPPHFKLNTIIQADSFQTQAFCADTLTVQYLVSVDGLVVNCP